MSCVNWKIFLVSQMLILGVSACNPLGGRNSQADAGHTPGLVDDSPPADDDQPASEPNPTISFSGVSSLSGARGQSINLAPTELDAGEGASITNCEISSGGTLPSGLTLNSQTCVLSGELLSLLSTTTFELTVTNSFSKTATAQVSLGVSENYVDSNNNATGFGGASKVGLQWNADKLILAADTDCDGNMSEGETVYTNCSELDSTWTPQWDSLVHYWKFNGSLAPSRGSSTLTAYNGATFSSTNMKLGSGAASFDGVDDYLSGNLPINFNSSSEISISFWHYVDSAPSQSKIPLFFITDSTWIQFTQLANNAGYWFQIDDGDNTAGVSGTVQGKWTHVVGTHKTSDNKLEIYMNGYLDYADDASIPLTGTTHSIYLGNNNGGSHHIHGKIDDLAIWNKKLTEAEIRHIYQRQVPKFSGQIESRVMDYGASNSWSGLKWISTLPFGKEIPADANASGSVTIADSESSSDYSSLLGSTGSTSDNNLSQSLVSLFQFEGAGRKEEVSGENLTYIGNGWGKAAVNSFSKLGQQSANFDRNDEILLTEQGSNMGVLTGPPLTISSWIYMESFPYLDSSIGVIVGKCVSDCVYYFAIKNQKLSLTANASGTTTIYDSTALTNSHLNRWLHVAVTVTSGNLITFYVDGQAFGTATYTGTGTFGDPTTGMVVGAMRDDNGIIRLEFSGFIDETAIWSRALHVSEIHQLHRRGSNNILYQVRSCTTADCSDNPAWTGASNTRESYFSETHNRKPYNFDVNNCSATNLVLQTSPSLMFSCFSGALSQLTSQRYLQYRAILSSDNSNASNCDYGSGATWCSPELKSVEVIP